MENPERPPSRRQLVAVWLILSVGMAVIVLLGAKDRGLTASQLGWLAAASVALASACTWMISWG